MTTIVPDVLRKAADIIDQRGWARKKDFDTATGGVCSNGAIRLALGQEVYGPEGRQGIGAPLTWTSADFARFGPAIKATHKAVDEYLETTLAAADIPVGWGLPRVVYFNDVIAPNVDAVTGVFRDAAAWLESNVTDALTDVELSTPDDDEGTAAPVGKELVLA